MQPLDLAGIAHLALALAPSPLLRYQQRGRHVLREGLAFTTWNKPGPSFNKVAVFGPSPPLERVLELANEFYAGQPGGYGLLFEADREHPIEVAVRARGWTVVEEEPALVMPGLPSIPPPPDGLTIRCLTTEAELPLFYQLLEAGFEVPPGSLDSLRPAPACVHDGDIAFLAGEMDGRTIGSSALCCVDSIAVIAGVAVLPAYRRRGYGTALTWAALAEAAGRGCTRAVLNAGPLSYALYCRMGFLPACRHRTYAAPAPV